MAKRILIVENDSLIYDMMHMRLTKFGWTVTVAEDGKQGLEAYSPDKFDVVSTDLDMPVMDGMDFTKELLAKYPGTIVFMCSGGNDDMAEEFRKAGGHAFYPKENLPDYLRMLNDLAELGRFKK